jgi:hypothetical protein
MCGRNIIYLIWVFISVIQFSLAQSSVNVICDEDDATLYVNGVKKLKIKAQRTPIVLPAGEYELMVSKPLDEDWHLVGRKNIVLLDEKSIEVPLSMNIEKISKKTNKSSADNFTKTDDIVVDKVAKLVWQDNTSVVTVKKNWMDAQAYCKALSLNDKHDWRLPTYDELITIVDYTKHTLAVMPAFKHIVSEYYWSSTVDSEDKEKIKNIYFGNGCPDGKLKKNLYFVRCVRKLK